MDTLSAFAMGRASQGKPRMVFDWDKAAELIRERKPQRASAGLSGDWEYTGDTIFADGKPVTDSYTYLASTWAPPEIDIDGAIIECWLLESELGKGVNGWDENTKWPESALAILAGDGR